ncbi:MAG: TolC family protein, partial [Candidatus Omnitrophota bacterium]
MLLAGCSSLKAPKKYDEFWQPPKWEKTTKSADLIWLSIKNQKIDSSKPLTLAEITNIALRNNPSILQAMDNARAAHARVKQAESTWYPQISAVGDFTKDKKVANLRADSINTRSYGGSAEANMLAMDFGGRAAAVKKAYHELIAANYDFNQTVQDVVLEAERSYYVFYSAETNLRAAEDNVKDAKMVYHAAEQKLKVGVAARLDMLQARSNYEQSLFDLEQAKGDVKAAKADVAVVMGLP